MAFSLASFSHSKHTRKAHIEVRKNKTWVRFRCGHTVASWCACRWSTTEALVDLEGESFWVWISPNGEKDAVRKHPLRPSNCLELCKQQ
jgi:hypothetical protein